MTRTVDRVARGVLYVWRLIKGWLPQTLGTAATAFSIIWSGYGGDIWTDGQWALVVTVALAIASLLAQFALQRPTYMQLAKQRDVAVEQSAGKSEAIRDALTVLLRKIAEYCELTGNGDRASVYYFHDEQFVMLARWSIHPKYARPGRGEYPVGQGAIGAAWDRGAVATTGLPLNRKRWNVSLEKNHGMPEGTAAKLAMQCRSIAALRIEDRHAVGVIVFESTDPGRADQAVLDKLGTSMLFATLVELVAGVASHTPEVERIVQAAEVAKAKPTWKPV